MPERVAGQPSRSVQPSDALGAAWGDPAIVLRCGVPKPPALTASSSCFLADGVGWFATQDGHPDDGLQPVTGELVFTTVGRTPYVELSVPPDYQPASDALVDLAPAVKATTSQQRPCV